MLRNFRILNALILVVVVAVGLGAAHALAQEPRSRVEGEGLLAADPLDPEAYIRYARFLRASGELEDAQDVLETGRNKANGSIWLLLELAEVYEERDQLARAEATARDALRMDSEFVDSHLLLGHLRIRLGLAQAGLESYRTAFKIAPERPTVQVRLVEGFVANGLIAEAEDHCLRFLAEDGSNADLWLALGRVFEDQDKLREAFTTYGQVMTLEPENDEANARQGRLFCRFGQFEAARTACQRALELNPDNLIAHAYLGIASSRLGDHEGARRHAKVAEAGGLNMSSVWEKLAD